MKGDAGVTGRELILYILENHLEDKPVFEDGRFVGYISFGEAATSMDVGIATIGALIRINDIEHIQVNGETYLPFYYKQLVKGVER